MKSTAWSGGSRFTLAYWKFSKATASTACPACGKPLHSRQKYCSETCRKFAMPQPTPQKVAELANKRIQKLIARIAQGNRKLKRSLTEEYFIKL